MKKELYEKLGLFYLGKQLNFQQEPNGLLELIKNKNLTTHAAIIGMTGSGKTGLGIALLEEAAIDGIPALIVDPKGDMGNLLLTFDDFDPKKFEPWIDIGEAKKANLTISEYAVKIAKRWKEGVYSFHQDENRVKRLKNSAHFTIYTPGSSAGVPLSMLSNFKTPPKEIKEDIDSYNFLLTSTTTSLLSLIDVDDESAFVLLSNIIDFFWQQDISPLLEDIIASIINPPFKKIGILPLESFYPSNQRMQIALKLNNLISNPSFKNWLIGEELNISTLLYTPDGKPKHSIFYIAHLNEKERMFFVTKLLNALIAWMRKQSGTSALKALFYMDEIYGYFPPNANPPSKKPMLKLLKQARAYGISIVLSTQNPADIDYKGLSNIGTWFLGRLQTKQDIQRVIDGLIQSNISIEKKDIQKLLTSLKKRVFLLKSIHKESLELFTTRWVLSFLKGPLSLDEIRKLTPNKRKQEKKEIIDRPDISKHKRVVLSKNIEQIYEITNPSKESFTFAPFLFAQANIHFYSQRYNIDKTIEKICEIPLDANMQDIDFSNCTNSFKRAFKQKAPANSFYLELPSFIQEAKNLKDLEKKFKDYIYQNFRYKLYRVKKLSLISYEDENIDEFRARVLSLLQDRKNIEIEKLQDSFAKKIQKIQEKLDRLHFRLEELRKEANSKTADTIISIGMALLESFFGRKKTISKASKAISRAKNAYNSYNSISYIEKEIKRYHLKLQALEEEFDKKSEEIEKKYLLDKYPIDEILIRAKKSDIKNSIKLLWRD